MSARRATGLATASETARKEDAVVDNVVNTIDDDIAESSEKIVDITSVIGIAFRLISG